jgi:uncharacterized protein YjbI with pentapeptide repeats
MVIVWRKRDRETRRSLSQGIDDSGRDLRRCRLVGMDLRHKNLEGADLSGADLTEAELGHANLGGANLRTAFLTGAQLEWARLDGACLDGAYLIATNFHHATMNEVTLRGAIWDEATTWPNGTQSPPPFGR